MIDSGTFDWKNGKFPFMTSGQQLPRLALGATCRTSRSSLHSAHLSCPLRNLGACLSPENSWQFLQGIETLPLRMDRHCENALAVAKYLKGHDSVEWVRFPGLEDDPIHVLNQKYLDGKGGSMVVFGIKGDGAGPSSSTTCSFVPPCQRRGCQEPGHSSGHHDAFPVDRGTAKGRGITPELVRLSIGIEHADDIIADIEQALSAATS